jgi:hypothetical protein
MLQYHYIMQVVWLIVSAGIIIVSTWMGFQDGFNKWWMMYLFLLATLLQYYRHKVQHRKVSAAQKEAENGQTKS